MFASLGIPTALLCREEAFLPFLPEELRQVCVHVCVCATDRTVHLSKGFFGSSIFVCVRSMEGQTKKRPSIYQSQTHHTTQPTPPFHQAIKADMGRNGIQVLHSDVTSFEVDGDAVAQGDDKKVRFAFEDGGTLAVDLCLYSGGRDANSEKIGCEVKGTERLCVCIKARVCHRSDGEKDALARSNLTPAYPLILPHLSKNNTTERRGGDREVRPRAGRQERTCFLRLTLWVTKKEGKKKWLHFFNVSSIYLIGRSLYIHTPHPHPKRL